jgi:NAD(P)-dependent dehydrogenase (short-subunit alcohol dehydrogenase family)
VSSGQELSGTNALITGGGRGIGLATARELAARGSGLVLLDRAFTAEAEALLGEMRGDGRTALSLTVDLAQHEALAGQLQELLKRAPAIDIVVNNAGVLVVRPFLEVGLDEWRRHLDINLTAMLVVTQAVLPQMLERGRGRIINVSSELGLSGMADYTAYCASKGGVIAFTKALSREVAASGVRVNSVAPGPTVTKMLTEMTDEHNDENRLKLPAQRFGEPEDIARTVAFLAGPGGDFFVGQVLSPNGGAVI